MHSHTVKSLKGQVLAAAIVGLMTGCGGGGGGGDSPAPPIAATPLPPPPTTPPVTPPTTPPVATFHTVGGSVAGLGPDATLTLASGSEQLQVRANGSFAFPNKVQSGTAYSISAVAPGGYTCRVSEGTGVVAGADVSKVAVACAPVLLAGVVGRLQVPQAVTSDGSGNLYVADSGPRSLLKIAANGAVSVAVGGSGKPGYADGPAASALFGHSSADVAADAQGNIFVADTCNNVIRKIGPDGTVSTLAGKAVSTCGYDLPAEPLSSVDSDGTVARFNTPTKIISDGFGGVLVLEAANGGRMRSVSASGFVTSVTWKEPIGTSPNLTSMARSADGTLYFSDGSRVWKGFGNTLWILAGQTSTGDPIDGVGTDVRFSGIQDMQVVPGGVLHVADKTQVRKVMGSGAVTTVAGRRGVPPGTDGRGSAAGFGSLGSIAFDGTDLVVLDTEEGTLRRVTYDGLVTTLAATPAVRAHVDGAGSAARFNQAVSLAADAEGNLYTTDHALHVLRKTTPDGNVSTIGGQAGVLGATDGPLATALFNQPFAVAAGRDGVLWVAQRTSLRRIQNGVVTTVNLSMPALGLTVDADGNAIVSGTEQVLRVTPSGQTTVLVTVNDVATLLKKPVLSWNVEGMAVDAAGNLYLADPMTALVYKRAQSGELSVFAGTPFKSGGNIDGPAGTATLGFYGPLAIDDKGNLYVTGEGVRMISPAGVVSSPAFIWGNTPVTALAYAKGKLHALTRYALLQSYLP